MLDPATGQVIASTDGSPMVDLTELEPGTAYTVDVRSRNDHTGAVSATRSVTFTTLEDDVTPEPTGDCEADYSASSWGGNSTGFTASVTVTNTSAAPVNGWSVTFAYPGGQTVDEPGWSAVVSQEGSTVTVAHPAWQSSIAPGQSVTFGFNGAATTAGTHPAPVGFALNGVACG